MIEVGSDGRVLVLALAVCTVLGTTLVVRRSPPGARSPVGSSAARVWIGAVLVLLANAPICGLHPWSYPEVAFGDAVTHARVAAELSEAHSSWITSFLGGFPVAQHYPPAGWLLTAALITARFTPLGATHLVGWLALLGAPFAVYVALVRVEVRVGAALVGSCFVAWVAPSTAFVGGYEAFFRIGVLSQVLAMPALILAVSFVARARTPWPAIALFGIATATHPQVTAVGLFATIAGAAFTGDRDSLERAVRAGLGAVGVGVALYGPGLLSLGIPFGWPSLGWRHLGFEPRHVAGWLRDGSLLDLQRSPVLTDLAVVGMFTALVQVRKRGVRAALVACAAVLVVALGGHVLAATPGLRGLLSFLQPMRALALLPVALGIVVAVSLEASTLELENLAALLGRRNLEAHIAWAAALGVFLFIGPAFEERLRYGHRLEGELASLRDSPCGRRTPTGYDHATMQRVLGSLENGRLFYSEDDAPAVACLYDGALQLATRVPLAGTLAAGAHVGVAHELFPRVDLVRSGSDERAQHVGVRWALSSEPLPSGWTRVTTGPLALWQNERTTSLVGAGCIAEVWRGDEAELRDAIHAAERDESSDELLDPGRLVAWEVGGGPLTRRDHRAHCDAVARVSVTESSPGFLDAEVRADGPTTVVFRVTSHPGWTVTVDGSAVPIAMVSPGFPAVAVPGGAHHVVARFGPTAWTFLGAFAGLALFTCAGVCRRSPLT